MARALSGRPTADAAPPALTHGPGTTIASHQTSGMTSAQARAENLPPLPKITITELPAPVGIDALAAEIWPDSFIKGKLNIGYPMPQVVLNAIAEGEETANGPLWTAEEIDAQKTDYSAWQLCEELYEDYSVKNIGRLFRQKMDAVAVAVASGQRPEPPPPGDRFQQEAVINEQRKAIAHGKATISNRVHNRIEPKGRRLKSRASIMALDTVKQERAAAAKAGLPYQHTPMLKALVFIAVKGWDSMTCNFVPGHFACLYPSNDWFGRKLFDYAPTPSQQEAAERKKAVLEAGERMLREHREFVAKKAAEDAAKTSGKHSEEVEALNTLHDRLRAEAQSESEARRAEWQRTHATPVRMIQ